VCLCYFQFHVGKAIFLTEYKLDYATNWIQWGLNVSGFFWMFFIAISMRTKISTHWITTQLGLILNSKPTEKTNTSDTPEMTGSD